ncbi:hypothetical protein Vretimale_2694 [Volvox reticuliferus]|uniref:Uncharacterized protein n=1 Tax=Volvox reticuliferus TaxID=1737510 RepID=A0A8J4FGR9_9CHLO|nr:hypothetical protein Vretifemale_2008 [Volvox reticuliferus]GIL96959.1 hypothetical protein Vretimale_2694 [Volvox reticuliferus]
MTPTGPGTRQLGVQRLVLLSFWVVRQLAGVADCSALWRSHLCSILGYLMANIQVGQLSGILRAFALEIHQSVEAEYQATLLAVREALWFRKLAWDLGLSKGPVAISLDSQGALSLGTNSITSVRSKHIDVHHHVVRERVSRGEVVLGYCSTERMVADVLTKPLGEVKFRWCREALGVVPVTDT